MDSHLWILTSGFGKWGFVKSGYCLTVVKSPRRFTPVQVKRGWKGQRYYDNAQRFLCKWWKERVDTWTAKGPFPILKKAKASQPYPLFTKMDVEFEYQSLNFTIDDSGAIEDYLPPIKDDDNQVLPSINFSLVSAFK